MPTPLRGLLALLATTVLVAGCGSEPSPAELIEQHVADPPASDADTADGSPTSDATPQEEPGTPADQEPDDAAAADGGAADDSRRWPSDPADLDPAAPAQWTVEVLATAPHDPEAFTQGLERLDDGRLLESTGRRRVSEVRIVDPSTGAVELAADLEPEEFGEGLTVVDGTVVQLTWQEQVARRWSLPDLTPLPSFTYEGEGWGLCLDGDRLAMSDGSSTLEWRDPETFAVLDSVTVRLAGEPIASLNELECVGGVILANVWRSPFVLVIRPDGAVVATIDATLLVDTIASDDPTDEVLNGIAAEPDGTFSMTGKLWPTRFVVRLVDG